MIIYNIVGSRVEPRTAEASALVLQGLADVMLMLRAFELRDADVAMQKRSNAIDSFYESASLYAGILPSASDARLRIPTKMARNAESPLRFYGHEEMRSERDLVRICEQEVTVIRNTVEAADDIKPSTGRAVMNGASRTIMCGLAVSELARLAQPSGTSAGSA